MPTGPTPKYQLWHKKKKVIPDKSNLRTDVSEPKIQTQESQVINMSKTSF